MKVLLIEDQEYFRKDMTLLLEEEGFEAIDAEDGSHGIQKAIFEKPDAILCDIDMPNMDGFKVLEKIRSLNAPVAETPFLFLTGLDDSKNQVKGMKLLPDDYITKPVELDVLVARLNMAINRKKNLLSYNEAEQNVDIKEINKLFLGIIDSANKIRFSTCSEKRRNKLAEEIVDCGFSAIPYVEQIAGKNSDDENSVPIKKIIETITASVKREKEHKLKSILIRSRSSALKVVVDFKYFVLALEEILAKVAEFTPDKGKIIIYYSLNDAQEIVINIVSESLTKDQAEEVVSLELPGKVLRLHGAKIFRKKGENVISVVLPEYRWVD